MIKEVRMNTYYQRLFCDKCEIEMTQTDRVWMMDPPKFKYECSKCGATLESTVNYPAIAYRNEDEEK